MCLLASPAFAQLTTGAGGGKGDGSVATNAAVAPRQIAADNGSVYFAEAFAVRARRPNGIVERIGGTYYRRPDTIPAPLGPFPALATPLNGPTAVAAQMTETYAAVGDWIYVFDGGIGRALVTSGLRNPYGLAIGTDPQSGADVLFIADTGNARIAACVIPATSCTPTTVVAGLTIPMGLAANGAALYIAENAPANRIRKWLPGIGLSTVAGGGVGSGDGVATAVALTQPGGVAVAPDGTVYIAETGKHRVRRVKDGQITTIAGTGQPQFLNAWVACTGNCDPLGIPITSPTGIAVDGAALWVASESDQRLYRIDLGAAVPTMTATNSPRPTDTAPPTRTATRTNTPLPPCEYNKTPINAPCAG